VCHVGPQTPKWVAHAKSVTDLRAARFGEVISQETVHKLAQTVAVEVLDDVADEEAEQHGTQRIEDENPDIDK
jgi:hypothetical protein